jgi:hypothetical protein
MHIDTDKIINEIFKATGRAYSPDGPEMDIVRMLTMVIEQYDQQREAVMKEAHDDAAANLSSAVNMLNNRAKLLETTLNQQTLDLKQAATWLRQAANLHATRITVAAESDANT